MKVVFIILAMLFAFQTSAQEIENAYHYKVDITRVHDDKLTIELEPPKTNSEPAVFHLPKIVPGTYSIYDFGRFVSDFQALKKNGKRLKVNHPDPNTWTIKKAKKLDKILYSIEDTWDTKKKNKVFEPAGTNIEKELNFVFNNHGIFGFFKGQENLPVYLEVTKPNKFFGASTLERVGGDSGKDIFKSPSYYDLVDHPLMYSLPDTAIIKVGNANVLVANYSSSKQISARMLAREIAPILEGQRKYLGGTLPVDKYAFIFYLTSGFTSSGGFGALEHNYSSMYVLPEMDFDQISQMVRDVAAHEFFHIVTPLNIHSDEIHYFDFLNPKMSQHLWLYEGVTEYSAGHVQVKHGLMSVEDYLEVLADKVRGSEIYKDDLPFTVMSLGCLDKHKDEYTNVYQKGALIGLCLDLKLRILSDGKYGIQDLMNDLAKAYGKDKPFNDNELFDKIVSMTYPDLKQFFDSYVAGPTSLPLKELLSEFGIEYSPHKMKDYKTLGGLENSVEYDPTKNRFFIKAPNELHGFAKKLGLQKGDYIETWNGAEMTGETINSIMNDFYLSSKEGDEINLEISREGSVVNLVGHMEIGQIQVDHAFDLVPEPSDRQLMLRNSWLGDFYSDMDGTNSK